jgi:transaldolase
VDQLPAQSVLDEIERTVDVKEMEDILMEEGIHKFAEPQKALLARIAEKRAALEPVGAK